MPRKTHTPVACGVGFVALDVVIDSERPDVVNLCAGGTCGNVLTILSYLGWQSVPIGRLKQDFAGRTVSEDLKKWHVNVDLLGLEPQASTPIVIEELSRTRSGQRRHRYLWTCPGCGAYLPSFRPVPAKSLQLVLPDLEPANVFFFDRVSRGAVDLAKAFSEIGALVVFEPSAGGDPKLFREALQICHVLKYSDQRARSFSELLCHGDPLLEVETLGEDGLRYRCQLPRGHSSGWRKLGGFEIDNIKDTAGSGDWCTAGLLSCIGKAGQSGVADFCVEQVESALTYGQALAALNCRFEGARGAMYRMQRDTFEAEVRKMLEGAEKTAKAGPRRRPHSRRVLPDSLCPSCQTPISSRRPTGNPPRIKARTV